MGIDRSARQLFLAKSPALSRTLSHSVSYPGRRVLSRSVVSDSL